MALKLDNQFYLYIIVEIIALINLYPKLDQRSFFILLIVIVIIHLVSIKEIKRRQVLTEKCDPNAYIKIVNDKLMKKGKIEAILKSELILSKAASLYFLGKFDEALKLLLTLNQSALKSIDQLFFVYKFLHLECLYELGQISEAKEIYENELSNIDTYKQVRKKYINLFIAENSYYLGKYHKAKDFYDKQLKEKHVKIIRMSILFKLALINKKLSNHEIAKEMFDEVASSSPKLWIAKKSELELLLDNKLERST